MLETWHVAPQHLERFRSLTEDHWMPWAENLPSLSTFVMSIHHLDTFRYWLGTPDRVLASTRPDPRTKFAHRDGINLYILEYDSGVRASSWDDVWGKAA